jgi:threonylcarbamoyladenosine tRNA methylthiotransferase MtaB
MKKVAAVTFGCKVNQYETACILDDFREAGYEVANFKDAADVYIINSCTVTNRTDYKSRNAIRKALARKEINPQAKVIVTGCYVQINYEKIKELGPIDLVIDNNKKNKIIDSLNRGEAQFSKIEFETDFAELSTSSMLDRSRAFIKVQDGCDFFCAYCAVPFGRGNPRSREPENVINQIKQLTQNGYKEFVLGGVNLGLYGREKQTDYHLHNLLRDLENINEVKILRLSSIEPQLFDDALLDFFKDSRKIAPHFHIPLQSGSDEILKKMNRRYTVDQFRNRIYAILKIIPDAAIGLDVITGLPGETELLFQETFDLLNDLPISYLHVFSYSRRPGTKAAGMSDQVKGDIIKKRSTILSELSNSKKKDYTEKLLTEKTLLTGIAEKQVKDYWTALSDHYIRIYTRNGSISEKSEIKARASEHYLDGIKV